MQLIKVSKASRLSIPIDRIDYINWEESAGGKALMKLGTGGIIHHIEFDSHAEAEESFNRIMGLIEQL